MFAVVVVLAVLLVAQTAAALWALRSLTAQVVHLSHVVAYPNNPSAVKIVENAKKPPAQASEDRPALFGFVGE